MILQLISSLLVSCSVGAPLGSTSLPTLERSNAITEEINGDYDVEYKYQSNEVNSLDDLIEGNIYNFEIEGYSLSDILPRMCGFTFRLLTTLYYEGSMYLDDFVTPPYFGVECVLTFYVDEQGVEQISLYNSIEQWDNYDYSLLIINDDASFSNNVIIQYLTQWSGGGEYSNHINDYLTYTDYNEIKSITPVTRHSNLYTLIYNFYYYLFENGTLGGINTDFNIPFDSWLAHTMTIVTLLTLIVVIFFFLKWLFRVVSGLILLKR